MVDSNPTIAIISSNINSLNEPINRLLEMIKK